MRVVMEERLEVRVEARDGEMGIRMAGSEDMVLAIHGAVITKSPASSELRYIIQSLSLVFQMLQIGEEIKIICTMFSAKSVVREAAL